MKIIEYWQAVKQVESSTPNDTLDDFYVMGEYVREAHAQKAVELANKKLFNDLRKSPGYPLTHTKYFVRFKELRLIEIEPYT